MNFSQIVQRVKSGELKLASAADKMIAVIKSLDDAEAVNECKAQSAAVAAYLQAKGITSISERNALEKVRAAIVHRLGQLLAVTVKAGKRAKLNSVKVTELKNIPTELGDTQSKRENVSKRSQAVAKFKLDAILKKIDEATECEKPRVCPASQAIKKLQREAAQKEMERVGSTIELSDSPIHCGDFRKLGKIIPDASVDLIFTDPPYDRKTVPIYEELAEFANRILVPGGSCVVYFGQQMLPDVMQMMTKHLRFWWTLACIHTGQTKKMLGAGVIVEWKPMLWFVKGNERAARELLADAIFSEQQKTAHEWQQGMPEALKVIKALCRPGGMVVDPFCGGGTTCVAAKELNRRFMAFEIDSKTATRARGRLNEQSAA